MTEKELLIKLNIEFQDCLFCHGALLSSNVEKQTGKCNWCYIKNKKYD